MTQNELLQGTQALLESVFAEDASCEVPAHPDQPEYHSGDGEWYLTLHCRFCDRTHTILICDKYRNLILSIWDDLSVCHDCGKTQMTSHAVKSMMHRG